MAYLFGSAYPNFIENTPLWVLLLVLCGQEKHSKLSNGDYVINHWIYWLFKFFQLLLCVNAADKGGGLGTVYNAWKVFWLGMTWWNIQ